MTLSYTGFTMNSIDRQPDDIRTLEPWRYPFLLRQIEKPPKHIYVRGAVPTDDHIFLTVVGSRRYSEYGKSVCEALIAGLRDLPVVIVSGLAYGIDSIAHEAALDNGLTTIAVPGSGLADDMLYPSANKRLAGRILSAGGCLLSPFENTVFGNKWTFPFRNRIMAGLSHATLVIEAERDSGTLITAKHAADFSRDVLVVPGSIFSTKSDGPHSLMMEGAIPITSIDELIRALGLESARRAAPADNVSLTEDECSVVKALASPLSRDALLSDLDMPADRANAAISSLELRGILDASSNELRLV